MRTLERFFPRTVTAQGPLDGALASSLVATTSIASSLSHKEINSVEIKTCIRPAKCFLFTPLLFSMGVKFVCHSLLLQGGYRGVCEGWFQGSSRLKLRTKLSPCDSSVAQTCHSVLSDLQPPPTCSIHWPPSQKPVQLLLSDRTVPGLTSETGLYFFYFVEVMEFNSVCPESLSEGRLISCTDELKLGRVQRSST